MLQWHEVYQEIQIKYHRKETVHYKKVQRKLFSIHHKVNYINTHTLSHIQQALLKTITKERKRGHKVWRLQGKLRKGTYLTDRKSTEVPTYYKQLK